MIWLQLGLAILGLAALYFGAEWLVGGSSRLAIMLGVSPLIVGLTIVAFGTSSPELLVSLRANFSAETPTAGGDFVLANIIGSNIYNIALILGIAALIRPIQVHRQLLVRELPILVLATVLFMWFVRDQTLGLTEGMIFIAGLMGFLLFSGITSYRQMQEGKAMANEVPVEDRAEPVTARAVLICCALIIAGLAGLMIGAELLVTNAKAIAKALGVSEAVISFTLVAFGTSLPELATVIVASIRREGDLISGNVVGSNIFNIFAVLGITAVAKPLVFDSANVRPLDLWFMTGLTFLIVPLLFTRRSLGRCEGGLLVAVCLVYSYFLYQRVTGADSPTTGNAFPPHSNLLTSTSSHGFR